MEIHHLSATPSILNKYLAEIRDVNIQKDSMRFRRNIERIGEFMANEISKTFRYKNREIQTPLGIKTIPLPDEQIVIASILRAGLPLHNGLLNIFDHAGNAFISAYRKHTDENHFEIAVEYLSTPPLEGKTLLLADPMLATGRSLFSVYKNLIQQGGNPEKVHLISVIASRQGIDYVRRNFPANVHLWVADVDEELNQKSYIVPGLGDAGDLAYGEKL